MFIRPGFIRLIPAAIVGMGWAINVALAYIKGSKILKEKEESGARKTD
jgi:hypothetical protein